MIETGTRLLIDGRPATILATWTESEPNFEKSGYDYRYDGEKEVRWITTGSTLLGGRLLGVKSLLAEHADWLSREGITTEQVRIGAWDMTPDRKTWMINFTTRLDLAFKEDRL